MDDNTGFIKAIKNSELIICCCILDPEILNNPCFHRPNLFQFFRESLLDLERKISSLNGTLFYFYDNHNKVIDSLAEFEKIEAIYCNRDYTKYSIRRDKEILESCKKNKIDFYQYNDLLLTEPERIKNKYGRPYTVFSFFYKSALKIPVNRPQTFVTNRKYFLLESSIKNNYDIPSNDIFGSPLNQSIDQHGGRTECEKILAEIERFKYYKENRDFPYLDSTTKLSPHIKFGNCSIREIYYKILDHFGNGHPLIRQLYWRDFFTHIGFHFPHVFKKSFKVKFQKVKWIDNQEKFLSWCNGMTGFPIVDAGVRELNSTGNMHNRVRMITASFLIKDLHINWMQGERYFASKLIDYDPCVNNGNWQWVASTGCDSQPYFRIFNPWVQQKKFDPDCNYIKKWIPELQDISNEIIHNWNKKQINVEHDNINYPKPMVEHDFESKITKEIFLSAVRYNYLKSIQKN